MPERKRRKRYIKLTTTEFGVAATVPVSAVYECSECEDLTAFKKGETFTRCSNCQPGEAQAWYRTNEFIHFVTKNLNTEFDRVETIGLKLADWIAEVAGSVWFALFHVVWFWAWVHMNTGGSLFGLSGFDVYPFGLLTMIVSLEAIFLSTFILISQNRSAQKSELRAELDYQTNLNTEKSVAEVLAILHELREQGKLEQQKAQEVLEDANIRLDAPISETARQKRKRHHRGSRGKRKRGVIEQAGIDVVTAE